MNKRFTLSLSAMLVAAIAMDGMFNSANSLQTGAPAGHTGSPGDGAVCTNCHSGGSANGSEAISLTGLPDAGYTPGQTYDLAFTLARNSTVKFGFQLSPQNAGGSLLGTLASGEGSQLVGSAKYLTHTLPGTSGTNSRTWNFQWTAPSSGSGSVTFYAAANFTNNNAANSGDHIVLFNTSVAEATSVGIDAADTGLFSFGPNPTDGVFHLRNASAQSATATLYSMTGQAMMRQPFSGSVSIDLAAAGIGQGIYLLRLESAEGSASHRVVVR